MSTYSSAHEVRLRAAHYELGELQFNYAQAAEFESTVSLNNLPRLPQLWGWGSYYQTQNIFQLALQSAQRTLQSAQLSPADVDLIVLAASNFVGSAFDLKAQCGQLLRDLGCTRGTLEAHALNGCATLLSAMRSVEARIRHGEYRHVLVIGFGETPANTPRFTTSALFSDAACSCLLSVDGDGLLWRQSAHGVSIDEMTNGMRLSDNSDLPKSTVQRLLASCDLQVDQLTKVFSNNMFLPIKKVRDGRLGIQARQTFNANVETVGHCHVCDSLINISDYLQNNDHQQGLLYMLQADSAGYSTAILLETT